MTIKTVNPWATRHRPRRFEDVVGQAQVVARLQGAIKRRSLPNAIMLVGPSGVGKTTLARLFARYVNCATHDACGKCDSCTAVAHPDVEEMNAAEARGIDDVRALIQRARYRPRFNTRVFVIDEAHQMTPQSLQAFLKPLEEPPPNTMYILCTTDPQRFPNTVINRCLVLDLGLPTVEDVAAALRRIAKRESVRFPKGLYQAIAETTNGHVREAVNALENAANALAACPDIAQADLLQSVVNTASQDAQNICMRLTLGLYAAKPELVVKSVFALTDVTPAINQCIWFNEYVLAKMLDINTRHVFHSPANREFARLVASKVPKLQITQVLTVQRKLVALRNLLHTVSTKEISTMLAYLVEDR